MRVLVTGANGFIGKILLFILANAKMSKFFALDGKMNCLSSTVLSPSVILFSIWLV